MTLALKLKDFFEKNFKVRPKTKAFDSEILAAAVTEPGRWVSVWFDGNKTFCLMGNGQIRVSELIGLVTGLMNDLDLTESGVSHCDRDLWAVPMTKDEAASINQITIDDIRKEVEKLIGG